MSIQQNSGLHIKRFVDKVTAIDARQGKELTILIADAKNLHADITKILLENVALRTQLAEDKKEDVITVDLTGDAF